MTTTLYRLYDADGVLLYVGITKDVHARWREHSKSQHWWESVADARVEHFDSRDDASRAEEAAIKAERPVHNVLHNGGSLQERFPFIRVSEELSPQDCQSEYPQSIELPVFAIEALVGGEWIPWP